MREKCKRYREIARLAVFSNVSSAIMAVIFSSLVSTIINYYYQLTAVEKNVDIFSTENLETFKVTLIVLLLATLANLPLAFCATRFFLIISRKINFNRATMKEMFEPFLNVRFLLKGTVTVLITTFITVFGLFLSLFLTRADSPLLLVASLLVIFLVLFVYFTYCMSVFTLSDNPEFSPIKAMAMSRRIMNKNRWLLFRTILPILLVYVFINIFLGALMFFSFFIISIVQAVLYVTIAVVYDDLKIKSGS